MEKEHNRLRVISERNNIVEVFEYFYFSYLEVKDYFFKVWSQPISPSNVKYNLKCSPSSIKTPYSVHAYFWIVKFKCASKQPHIQPTTVTNFA